MRPRTLLILALLATGLGAFVWFYERELPTSEERVELAKKVMPLDEDQISRVTLEWEENRVVLEREAPTVQEPADDDEGEDRIELLTQPSPQWRITEPIAARADGGAVDRLLSSISDLQRERTLEDAQPQELGLEPPRAKVIVWGEEGEELVLEIGSEIPASSNMLARLGGKPEVFVVPTSVYSEMAREPGEWRDRTVFPAPRHEVERLTLQAGPNRILLARRGDQFWLESPAADRADEDHTAELLTQLTGSRVHAFVDDPEGRRRDLGLDPPQAVLTVMLKEAAEPFSLELGHEVADDAERSYARVDGQIFETTAKLREPLTRPVEEWRSRAWSSLAVFEITGVTVEDKEGTLALERRDTDWYRGKEKIAYTIISDLLYEVEGARAEKLVDATEMVLATPTTTITYRTENEGKTTLTLHAPTPDGVPARADDREATLLLSQETVGKIREKLRTLRDAEPLAEEHEQGEDEES